MTDYTIDRYYKYNGEEWLMLQNGENIIFAKKSALVKLTKDVYTLSDDSKTKTLSFDISNVDVIFIRK